MRLAEHVAGTVHVDEMLESLTPDQFNEWCAKDIVEPIGYQSQALGMIVYMIHSYLSEDAQDAEVFMPWLQHAPEAKHQNALAEKLLEQVAGGLKRG